MSLNGNLVPISELSEAFAGFFDKKVLGIVHSTKVVHGVYNGRRKINEEDSMFMTGDSIIECIKLMK